MKAKKIVPATLIVLLCASFWLGAQKENAKKKSDPEKEVKSLIKKDLLFKKRKKLGPPRRNIFSTRRSEIRNTTTNPVVPEKVTQELKDLITERISSRLLNIRYVGYINKISGGKIVALITFEENVLAVEEGEVIAEGVEVGKITRVEIEIIGPDSKKRKYPLEGEDK
jgi:Tfp pilus assembly protein PilP